MTSGDGDNHTNQTLITNAISQANELWERAENGEGYDEPQDAEIDAAYYWGVVDGLNKAARILTESDQS